MYGINDVFDYESDLRNPRKGGVEGAVLDKSMHAKTLWAVVIVNVPFLVYLFAIGSTTANIVLVFSMFAVVAYSIKGLRFKEIPVLDSMTSSTHFVSPAIYGLIIAGATVTPELWLMLNAFFLWGMASHAFGAVQDIQADRQAGLRSVATAFGAASTSRLAIGAYLLAIVFILAGALIAAPAWAYIIGALALVPYVVMVWPYRNLPDEQCEQANRGWRKFLWVNFVSGLVITLVLNYVTQFG
jgi:4-hydroxybenzoate polyprenyltransferase